MTEFNEFYQEHRLEILEAIIPMPAFMSLTALELSRRVNIGALPYSGLREITRKLSGNEIDLSLLEKMEKYQLISHKDENSSKIYFLTKFGEWFVENVLDPGKDFDYLASSLKEHLYRDKQ
jgi:predicted transcriptional regulator